MRRPSGLSVRVFLTCWIVFSAHFATNVQREHYPAFSLVDHGDFVLDEYAGFHSDIFQHTDGHWYIGNQVGTSILAAVPLFLFDPLLDRLEEIRREQLAAAEAPPEAEYRTPYPIRQQFLRMVRERGLDLRFAGATAVTGAFLMAPLSAALCLLFLKLFLRLGVPRRRAVWVTLLLAFGTPVFYRTAPLSNNGVLMVTSFLAFWFLWPKPDEGDELPWRRRFLGGLFAGFCVALDYSGAVLGPVLFGYLVLRRRPAVGWQRSLRESAAFALGCLPGFLLLWGTQWAMYGDPFLPGQVHMPDTHYAEQGFRGVGLPDLGLFLENLLSPNFGLLPYGPLVLFALVPLAFVRRLRGSAAVGQELLVGRAERRFALAYVLAFLTFCAMNQFSRMQWNTGFRYLAPTVPFFFLLASDFFVRLPARALAAITVPAVLHQWVLSQTRYTVPSSGRHADGNAVLESWRIVLREGPQVPWLRVAQRTLPADSPFVHAWWHLVVFALCGLLLFAVWRTNLPRRRSRPS